MKMCRALVLPLVTALATGASIGMAQSTQGPAPLPALPDAMRIDRDVEYARVGALGLRLDIYRRAVPKAGVREDPSPVIVWIHGRDGIRDDKFPTPAAQLVADGYAVVSIDYRPASEAPFPAPLHDAKAAIRWVRANAAKYGFDPNHIGAWGSAEGGQLATLLGTSGDVPQLEGSEGNAGLSSRVQAVVDFYGPVATAGPASPIAYATPDDGPFLIVQGTADAAVSPQQSETLQSALKQASVQNDLRLVPGAGHDIGQVMRPEVAEEVSTFFDTQLRGGRRQREDISRLYVPIDSFADPIIADGYGGTRYALYPTAASRGPGTVASYRIFLPPGYDLPRNARRRYPVIYYLHGKAGDSRSAVKDNYVGRADAAMRGGVMPPAIIILVQSLPTAGYFDSLDGRYPLESEIIRDLIPHVDRTWRTIPVRGARAIEGHSMGGNGALRLAFKHPDLFGSAASLSAALNPIAEAGGTKDRLNSMFDGDEARAEAEEAWTQAAKNAARIRGHMSVRMIVGDKDNLRTRNRWFSDVLTRLGIAHSLTLSPGAPHAANEVLARLETDPFAYYAKVFAAYR